eukprot:Rmarinus@m.5781
MGLKELFRIDGRYNGNGKVLFSWHPDGSFLATTADKKSDRPEIHIFDRYGSHVCSYALKGPCGGMVWDKDGALLAVLQGGDSGVVPLFDANTKKWDVIETGWKEVSFISWSKVGPQLAVGTKKGNLLVYNKQEKQSYSIVGKHSKAITTGCWSADNVLILGSEDKTLSLSDHEGNKIDVIPLKYVPTDVKVADQKIDSSRKPGLGQASSDQTISLTLNQKTLYIINRNDKANPVELQFQPNYGDIVSYHWYGDGYIMIGFSNGFLVVISTHMTEIGNEQYSARVHKDGRLTMLTYNSRIKKVASCGDSKVAIVDMASNFKEVASDSIDFAGSAIPSRVDFTRDGQMLCVGLDDGTLVAYLASVPVLHDHYDTRLVYPEALRELTVVDVVADETLNTIRTENEPHLIALGPEHVAVAKNHRVWYYLLESGELLCTQNYMDCVQEVRLNRSHVAIRMQGRVILHAIGVDPDVEGGEHESATFPEEPEGHEIASCALTYDFLILGSVRGSVRYFYVQDWKFVNDYHLPSNAKIEALYPNSLGLRVLLLTDQDECVLYSPLDDKPVPVPECPASSVRVLWDSFDDNVFVLADEREFHTYIYVQDTVAGPVVNKIATTPRDREISPIIIYNGAVTFQTQSGSLARIILGSHDAVSPASQNLLAGSPEKLLKSFKQCLALMRLKDAWELAATLNTPAQYSELARTALHSIDHEMAIRAYRKLGEAGMVQALERVQYAEDKNLLAGYSALYERDYNKAQTLFVASSQPTAALEMRKDLLQWEQALKLAQTFAADEVPTIAREYAQQLEFRGEYAAAHDLYLKGDDESSQAGVTRMTIRLGDIPRGMRMAKESGNKQLCRECAVILEGMKQFNDAAQLYQYGEMHEKAAAIYIQAREFRLAAPLMAKITVPKLHLQYAQAKEKEGAYQEAAKEYAAGKDMDSVVRLCLDASKLNNPQKAFSIVRQSRSSEGAQMVAEFCETQGDYRAAIEFWLMAKQMDRAFSLAERHDEMDVYAEALGEAGSKADYISIAKYFEKKLKPGLAGRYHAQCGNYEEALDLFLECGEQFLDDAIQVVGRAKNDDLSQRLIDYLLGEKDGQTKDSKHVLKLYLVMGKYAQAANAALLIAKQEQNMGNYKVAHQTLFETFRDLRSHTKIPQDFSQTLRILHSYILVKILVQQQNHFNAALMLIRVAKNISKFPAHVVPILTSTVIECQRARLYQSAFEYASMLMRPEYRKNIKEELRKKIEAIVRKRNQSAKKDNEVEEELTPCPHCKTNISETELECRACKNSIPYCIATGKHMVFDDWSSCPNCAFPALYSAMLKLNQCPMCEGALVPGAVQKIDDPTMNLKLFQEGEASGEPSSASQEPEHAASGLPPDAY